MADYRDSYLMTVFVLSLDLKDFYRKTHWLYLLTFQKKWIKTQRNRKLQTAIRLYIHFTIYIYFYLMPTPLVELWRCHLPTRYLIDRSYRHKPQTDRRPKIQPKVHWSPTAAILLTIRCVYLIFKYNKCYAAVTWKYDNKV